MSRSIVLNTPVPGPESLQIAREKERAIPDCIQPLAPFYIAEGRGALVTDVDGNVFIDFTGGWGCLAVGHSHPRVVEAIRHQAAQYTHTDFTAVPYESFVRLGKRLAELAPGRSDKRVAFFNSGAEAIENAVKIARCHTKRRAVVVFEHAFHGRTLLTMTMTHKATPYKTGFGPFASDIYRLPLPNPYRNDMNIEDFEPALRGLVDPTEVAAVVIEPVQGEGGFIVPSDGFIESLREITERYGIVLVADEIQTAFGRTGRMFAIEHYGVEPDLIAVGKSLAAGLPLSGVIGKREILDSLPRGSIGGTYVGNPIACRASLEVLGIIEKEDLLSRAVAIGETVRSFFGALQKGCSLIGDVRGLGAMIGVELVTDRRTKEPATAQCAAIVADCLENGLLVPSAGLHGNVLRMLMALVITDDQLNEGLDVLERAVRRVSGP
jgi:4-aminobutyrate aminotransferase/(S)-3-amino-2-methylpropionate transaminase